MEVARPQSRQHVIVVAMPGVPSEMKRMFAHEVLPRLGKGRQFIVQRCIHCFGLGESAAEEKLLDLTRRGRRPEVGITVHEATITLRITAQGTSQDECRQHLESTATVIYERLGNYIFGEDGDELEHAVARLLARADLTLSTAELGTDGLVAHRLTSVRDLGELFVGGVIVPSQVALVQVLGLSPGLVREATGAAAELAGAMAAAVRERLVTDLGLAVAADTGGAGGAAEHAGVALSTRAGLNLRDYNISGDPAITKSRTAKLALNMLRLHLLSSVDPSARPSSAQ
jgi:nicotinamide-nucleotide amidase